MKYCVILLLAIGLNACSGSPNTAEDTAENTAGNTNPTTPIVLTGPFKVLVYSRTDGFRHASIEVGIQAIQSLGAANDFTVDATEDPSQFTTANLAQYEVVIFLNTTLNVLDANQEAAFESYIRGGGNFVGVHSAADTEHDWPFYGQLVGAYFLAHPVANQPGELIIEDPDHPSVSHLPNPWALSLEEFYSFQTNPRDNVRVLARIDESSYLQEPNTSCDPSGPTFPNGYSGVMGDHPMSWCHDSLGGRAWYTALGHEAYLYQQDDYRQHLLNGILTAAKRVAARCEVLPAPANLPARQTAELIPCQDQLTP